MGVRANSSTESNVVNESPLRTVIISNIATVLISVSASYVALSGQDKTSHASIYQSTIERMNAQDRLISELRISQTISDLRIIELEAEIRQSGNHSSVLRAYINGLDSPAWIKRRGEDGSFSMYITNDAYSSAYGKSRYVYEGHKDSDNWPETISSVWRSNDLLAYRTGKAIRVLEQVPGPDGKLTEVDVWKFPIDLPDGTQGVAGIVILQDEDI